MPKLLHNIHKYHIQDRRLSQKSQQVVIPNESGNPVFVDAATACSMTPTALQPPRPQQSHPSEGGELVILRKPRFGVGTRKITTQAHPANPAQLGHWEIQ